jgi:hypothetical protein
LEGIGLIEKTVKNKIRWKGIEQLVKGCEQEGVYNMEEDLESQKESSALMEDDS